MRRSGGCPDTEALERHARVSPDAAADPAIERHLLGCASCRALLAEVSANLLDIEQVRDVLRREEPVEAASGPKRIGPFRIVKEIERGGMGVVYLAEQEMPRREVALKVLRAGSASAGALRRFELEAEALGQLHHPGIAAVFAAGVVDVESGGSVERVPYIAMEYVRGAKLDRYIQNYGLGVRDGIALLARIADAVHHAHVNGIVHRDLKPGNILVEPPASSDEGAPPASGAPKILDFGLARIVGAHAGESLRTTAGQVLGTVPYMSPEQLAGVPGAVDARADVYALGVIAYEMLAGRHPLDLNGKALAEAARMVRDDEPPRLGRIDPRFRGDIEAIVAKALEKDPRDRYQSASELASDLRRHLADQPVSVQPPSTVYQLRKMIRRNRTASALAAGLVLALFAFTGAMAILLDRARVAERRALTEARSAEEVTNFVLGMFGTASAGSRNPSEVSARELLESAGAQIPALAGQPEVQARMMNSVAGAYYSIGLYERSLSLLEEALAIRRRILGGEHAEVGRTETAIGRVLMMMGDDEAAEASLRRGLAICENAGGPESLDLADGLDALASSLHRRTRYEESIDLYRRALAIRRGELDPDHQLVGVAAGNLAAVLIQAGRYDEAEPLLWESLEIHRRRFGNRHSGVAKLLANMASLHLKRERPSEAEPLFREALEISTEIHGDAHPNVATLRHNLALSLIGQRRHAEAEPLLRRALTVRQQAIPGHWYVAETASVLGTVLAELGRRAEAETLLVSSAERIVALRGPEDEFAARAMRRVESFARPGGRD